LAALNRRHVTGEGCHVTTSLFETALSWMAPHIGGYLSGGAMRRPLGSGVTESCRIKLSQRPTGTSWWPPETTICSARCAMRSSGPNSVRDERFATNSKRVETAGLSFRCWRTCFAQSRARNGKRSSMPWRACGADRERRSGGRIEANRGARHLAESAGPRHDPRRPAARIRRRPPSLSFLPRRRSASTMIFCPNRTYPRKPPS